MKYEIANIAAHVPNIYSNLIFDRIRFKQFYISRAEHLVMQMTCKSWIPSQLNRER